MQWGPAGGCHPRSDVWIQQIGAQWPTEQGWTLFWGLIYNLQLNETVIPLEQKGACHSPSVTAPTFVMRGGSTFKQKDNEDPMFESSVCNLETLSIVERLPPEARA